MATTKQQMSVTQGLAELKLLDKRIRKAEDDVKWVDVSTKTQPVDEARLKRNAESEYQSYMALVARRDAIKRAIVLSNASTRVTIGSWEGTVAEAIEHKTSILYKKNLMDAMRSAFRQARRDYEEKTKETTERLDRLLQSELGKDVRTNPETIQAITASFRANNPVTLVDPLDLSAKVNALEEEVEAFETNVDWVLSEANGRTIISF